MEQSIKGKKTIEIEWRLPVQTDKVIRDNSENIKYDNFSINNLKAFYSDYHFKKKKDRLKNNGQWDYGKLEHKFTDIDKKQDFNIDENQYERLLNSFHKRQERFITSQYPSHKTQKRTPVRAIIVGKGAPSAFDSAISLHPTWGFPYIPGSSWQGVLRGLVIRHYFQSNDYETSEELALKDLGFLQIFGSTDQKGCLDFFDVYPTGFKQGNLHVEINNAHNTTYYTTDNNTPSTHGKSPIPHLYFVIINTSFVFRYGFLEGNKTTKIKQGRWGDQNLFSFIENHLNWLFKYEGIGARKKIGMGVFGDVL